MEVQIWSNIVLETKLPALVIVAFLLGLIPMWLIHRTAKWRMTRRVNALEAATTRMAAPKSDAPAATPDTAPAAPPAATPRSDLPPEPANPVDPEPESPR